MKQIILTLIALTTMGALSAAEPTKTVKIEDVEINRHVSVGSQYDTCFYACQKGADTSECKQCEQRFGATKN